MAQQGTGTLYRNSAILIGSSPLLRAYCEHSATRQVTELCCSSVQSSAFVMFPDVHSACAAASVLRDKTAVDAVEMFDRAALRCS